MGDHFFENISGQSEHVGGGKCPVHYHFESVFARECISFEQLYQGSNSNQQIDECCC